MSPLQAIVLAVVQGVTEFLPISSSAHLVLVPVVFGWPDQGLTFDMATHAGSLMAVLWYFRRDLAAIVRAAPAVVRPSVSSPDVGMARALIVATIPVAVAGLLLQDVVAGAARSLTVIAVASIGFGLLLGLADWKGRRALELDAVGLRVAIVVGLAQALALIPGTSRSGITITAALFIGFSRPAAARFSMLLSIPVMALVGAKNVLDIALAPPGTIAWAGLAIGFVGAALTAYAAIAGLLAWVERQSLQAFVVYRVVLGGVLLLAL